MGQFFEINKNGVKDKDISKSIQSLKNIYNPKKFGLGQEVFIFFETDGEIETLKQARLGNFIGFQFYYDTDSILKIEKMPFGHHGATHPVHDIKNNTVFITSQNHNFAVAEIEDRSDVVITHKSLFDGSIPVSYTHLTLPTNREV